MQQMAYFDHAAATPTDPEVAKAMVPYFTTSFGNPSSQHAIGKLAAKAVSESRAAIAQFINRSAEEVYFTGSGTESNNLAILGVARANKNKGKQIITTKIEHPSVLNACQALERDGYDVIYLPVTSDGLIEIANLKSAITKQTILVTTHFGNSELGVLQPIEEIGQICKENNIFFHVDACQAMAYLAIDAEKYQIDLLTFNGSKMYGPKGIAVLYVRDGVPIFPIVYGGGQERSLRSGTENVPAIVGLARAAEITLNSGLSGAKRITELRDELQKELMHLGARINAAGAPRLPNHLSVTLEKTKEKDLVSALDRLGIAASSGSACSSKDLSQSHVLGAIGLTADEANKTIRVTLGRSTTKADCDQLIAAIKKAGA